MRLIEWLYASGDKEIKLQCSKEGLRGRGGGKFWGIIMHKLKDKRF